MFRIVNARQLIIFSAVTLVSLVMLVSARNLMLGDGISIQNQIATTGMAVADTSVAVNSGTSGEIQKVRLEMEGYDYKLTPSTLKKGVPVEMEVDMNTVSGCMRDVVIPAFNVKKYVTDKDNTITFTPSESGTFNIVCSMNMGRGTFKVSEPDGTTKDYVEPAPASGASCGDEDGAGGCGCGA